MRFLIDTHTYIWFTENDEQLPPRVVKEIVDGNNEIFLSIASIWEIAIKASTGKLKLKIPFTDIAHLLARNNISLIPIEFAHLEVLLDLDFFHRDPFDRIIIAQAISESMTILSADAHFRPYPVKCLW